MSWRNVDDVLRDIQLYSVVNPNHKEPPPPTVLEYQARLTEMGNRSIYDIPIIPEENITLVNTGRGRSCFSTYRPGSNCSEPDDFEIIRRKLKEVNGVGFSNELIEENYRRKAALNTKPLKSIASSTNDEMFVDVSSESPTPTTSPFRKSHVPVPNSSTSSSPPRKKETSPINSLKPESPTVQPALPLSQILNFRRGKVEKPKSYTSISKTVTSNSEESSDESDYWWKKKSGDNKFSNSSSDGWDRSLRKKQEFDITSPTDFPELR